jgi:hypothetical protein
LLDEIRGCEPPIAVAVVTGSSDADPGESRIDADAVLGKPFTIDELRNTVRALAGVGLLR